MFQSHNDKLNIKKDELIMSFINSLSNIVRSYLKYKLTKWEHSEIQLSIFDIPSQKLSMLQSYLETTYNIQSQLETTQVFLQGRSDFLVIKITNQQLDLIKERMYDPYAALTRARIEDPGKRG